MTRAASRRISSDSTRSTAEPVSKRTTPDRLTRSPDISAWGGGSGAGAGGGDAEAATGGAAARQTVAGDAQLARGAHTLAARGAQAITATASATAPRVSPRMRRPQGQRAVLEAARVRF